MTEFVNCTCKWYQGVPTDDLLMLLEEAEEQSEYCPDASEKALWKLRLARMEDELLRRQERKE